MFIEMNLRLFHHSGLGNVPGYIAEAQNLLLGNIRLYACRPAGPLLHVCNGMRRIYRLTGIAIKEDALDVVRTWGCVVMRYGAISNAFFGRAAVSEVPAEGMVYRLRT